MSIFKKIWEKIKSIFKKSEKHQCNNCCECSCHIESEPVAVNEKSDIELKQDISEDDKTEEMSMEESSHEEKQEPEHPIYYGMTRAQLIEKIKEKNYEKGVSKLTLSELRRIYEQLYI